MSCYSIYFMTVVMIQTLNHSFYIVKGLQTSLSLINVDVFYSAKWYGVLCLLQEGPLRPVLECIDLLSDSEDEGCDEGCSSGTVSGWIEHLFIYIYIYIHGVNACPEFSEIVVPFILLQVEDKINCHKARVTSTLDRLAHQVALEKKERANKCRAFKVRLLQYQTIVFSRIFKHKTI